jgi:uracil phosphoribosyltransferase
MIATAGTLTAVIAQLKKWGCPNIHVVSVLASQAGLAVLSAAHPDVTVTVSAVDDVLSEKGYIIPGLGDAGDRLYTMANAELDHDEKLLSPSKRKKSIDN